MSQYNFLFVIRIEIVYVLAKLIIYFIIGIILIINVFNEVSP